MNIEKPDIAIIRKVSGFMLWRFLDLLRASEHIMDAEETAVRFLFLLSSDPDHQGL